MLPSIAMAFATPRIPRFAKLASVITRTRRLITTIATVTPAFTFYKTPSVRCRACDSHLGQREPTLGRQIAAHDEYGAIRLYAACGMLAGSNRFEFFAMLSEDGNRLICGGDSPALAIKAGP
jgi:hypothetical protein